MWKCTEIFTECCNKTYIFFKQFFFLNDFVKISVPWQKNYTFDAALLFRNVETTIVLLESTHYGAKRS